MAAQNESLPAVPMQPGGSNTWRNLRRCYTYLRPYWKAILIAYAATLALDALSVFNPQLIRMAIDEGISQNNTQVLILAAATLLVLTLIKGVFTFLQGRWSEVASQNVAYDLRADIQRKLTILSFSFHDQSEAGDLLSRAIQDVDRIRFLTGRATLRIGESVILLVGTAAILFWMNPQLALLAVATTPLLAYRSLTFGRRIRPLSLDIQRQLGVLTTRLEQNLRGARVVKSFAQEPAEIERFDKENEHWFDMSAESARLTSVNGPLLNFIANIGTIFILWYGGRLVIDHQLSVGELVAFMTYMAQLVGPVRLLGQIIPAVAQAGAAAERIFEILDAAPDVHDAPDAAPLPAVTGHVRFERVSFSYGRHQIFKDITFEAKPGQIIALLGRTGSGKSTVVNLVPRFFDPTSGRVTIDGRDIRAVTLASLRAQIGIVLQETTLFAATIRENIAFGKPGATDEEVVEAAQAAQAHDFIVEMAHGYDTYVGERGITLSGGQKQRIAIARALLTDPRILILDDATSSVDTGTERLIQTALDRLMIGRTTFVIAHRLSTVRMASLILVLDKGRIVARGTHEELLKTSDLYADIYHRQLKPQ